METSIYPRRSVAPSCSQGAMRLWIDNTGLHGAGKCILGQATTGYDFKGLLQLATLIVFSDTIELNEFEPDQIVENSIQFRSELLNLGLSDHALRVYSTSRAEYAHACHMAAEFAGEELEYRFRTDEQLLLGVPIANIPRGAQFRPERTEWLVAHSGDANLLQDIRDAALDTKAGGAIEYMLADSASLRRAIGSIIRKNPDWTFGHTFQVEAVLRAYLNEHLAKQINAAYAPAVHRADLVARQNRWILSQLSEALDPIVDELRPEPLGIPSVHEALIRRSQGDPKGLIGEALRMRELATPLRPRLRQMQAAVADGSAAAQHQIRKEIGNLILGVRADLELEGTSSIWDAITLDPSTGLPGPMTVKSLLAWLERRLQKSQRVVLTDVVLNASYSGIDEAVYRKLLARCFGTEVGIDRSDLPRLVGNAAMLQQTS